MTILSTEPRSATSSDNYLLVVRNRLLTDLQILIDINRSIHDPELQLMMDTCRLQSLEPRVRMLRDYCSGVSRLDLTSFAEENLRLGRVFTDGLEAMVVRVEAIITSGR